MFKLDSKKIEYIYATALSPSDCTTILKLLPNLKGFGIDQALGPVLSSCIDNDDDLNRFMNIIEFGDLFTNSTTLDLLVKYCPKVNRISLESPERNVIVYLSKFSLLTDIKIFTDNFDEVMNLIKIIGWQIKKLNLHTDSHEFDPNLLRELCPKLVILEINFDRF